jgi:quinol monooxygenase YgiN
MAALEDHLRQPHVLKLVESLPGMISGRPEIVAHEVSGGGPLPVPE